MDISSVLIIHKYAICNYLGVVVTNLFPWFR